MTFTINDARSCAYRYTASGRTCSGCRYHSRCNMGDRDRAGLVQYLDKIDPSRLNIVAVALAPMAQGKV